MKTKNKPVKFTWKIQATAARKHPSGTVVFQEQCSSSGGGNGRCGNK